MRKAGLYLLLLTLERIFLKKKQKIFLHLTPFPPPILILPIVFFTNDSQHYQHKDLCNFLSFQIKNLNLGDQFIDEDGSCLVINDSNGVSSGTDIEYLSQECPRVALGKILIGG